MGEGVATRGGRVFATITVTEEVAMLPAASLAIARSVLVPSGTVAVFHENP